MDTKSINMNLIANCLFTQAMPGAPEPEKVGGKPLVEPPEFGERIKDTEREPYWVPGAFPTIFQNETGDPFNYVEKEVDFDQWGPHVCWSRGWHAQTHPTFNFWWLNTSRRKAALSAKKWYLRSVRRMLGISTFISSRWAIATLVKHKKMLAVHG